MGEENGKCSQDTMHDHALIILEFILYSYTVSNNTAPNYRLLVLTYQVCALGSEVGSPYLLRQNFLGPWLPCSSEKPFIGTLDVPVTN